MAKAAGVKAAAKTAASGGPVADRRSALTDREAAGAGVKVTPLPPAERVSLRAPAESVASLSRALGVTLPQKPKTSAAKGSRIALWLGPDEWLVIDEAGKDLLAELIRTGYNHTMTEIHRP